MAKRTQQNESKKASSYATARATVQQKANETGFDFGMEWNEIFCQWHSWMLPRRESRFGHEARCEVVSCEILAKCQPGHGPR